MPVKIDVIILSYGKSEELRAVTKQGIESLLASEDQREIEFNILVVESNKHLSPYQYPNTATIYPNTSFGYNKYMNIGINATHNNYVCLSNNDLIYHKNWASEILKAMDNDPALLSATPYCPVFHKNKGFPENAPPLQGYFGVLIGWCIFVKREIFDIIGPLDENFLFWYADYDYSNTLEKYGVKNCLISSSFVTHLGSESLNTMSKQDHQKLTQVPRFYFSYKWHHKSYLKYCMEILLYKIKSLIYG